MKLQPKHLRIFLTALLLCLGSAACFAREPEVRIERDVIYTTVKGVDLKLNIVSPPNGNGPFPAVVCIHGGGWFQGQRPDMEPMAKLLAQRGYVAVPISYRLAPERFPAQIEDCKAVVRWLRANARKYNINSERIGAIGPSAGGHLSSLLGVTGPADGFEGTGGHAKQSSRVQAVVSFFGRSNFTKKTWDDKLEEKIFVPLIGASFKDKPERYRAISPISYVSKAAPPFLLFHGEKDELVPAQDSIDLAEKLQNAGVSAKAVIVKGVGHGGGDWVEKWEKQVEQAMKFFDDHLK